MRLLLRREWRRRIATRPKVTVAQAARRRKRLGQFFSGVKVGRLLAALAQAPQARTILDPMAGSGDLLQGCLDVGARPAILAGIEIDPDAYELGRQRLSDAIFLQRDAFLAETILELPQLAWDLVIGNPPFVRYQDGAHASESLPSALAVRQALCETLEVIPNGTPAQRSLLSHAASRYSGLADLALPACLLSMALVRPGGRLALVLPQSWLSRDYAQPLRGCLDELFDVETILEDEGATWFPDALVRTSLVVAVRRGGKVARARHPQHQLLSPKSADEMSLVGGILPGVDQPEIAFAQRLREGGFGVTNSILSHRKHAPQLSVEVDVVAQLSRKFGRTITLEALDVQIGQGLRTGANAFFYVQSLGPSSFTPSLELGGGVIEGAEGLLRPVLRDQRGFATGSAVLDLRTVALPEDLAASGALARRAYQPMGAVLANHVRLAAMTASGKPGRECLIPDLTAVRTNVRAARGNAPPRFWYMLPDFQPRHLPDVFIPRISNQRPHARLSGSRDLLVDANFITLRCNDELTPQALVALLNSAWCWAALEATGAVLGGGALKVESAMLRRIGFPPLTKAMILSLDAIGVARTGSADDGPWLEVDAALLGKDSISVSKLVAMAESRLISRSGENRRTRAA